MPAKKTPAARPGPARKTVRAVGQARAPKREASRSVERALQILIEIAKTPRPTSFADLQKGLSLPKATLHKLLSALE
ncbi:MAG: hypothetical protein EXR36_08435 [Betaproteobacteria bacterium]|nr:hypothetical protein [Betaproteobacteria bacterium]